MFVFVLSLTLSHKILFGIVWLLSAVVLLMSDGNDALTFKQPERKNVAKKGTKYPSREASEVYLAVQTVRKLCKVEVSRFN